MKAFLETEQHSVWARAMAAKALTIQVYEGDLDRRSTIDYAIDLQEKNLQKLREHPDDRANELIFDYLADIVGDLGEASDMRHIERWFGQDILSPMHAGIDWYQKEFDTPYAERREKALQRSEHYLRDAIASLSRAYCYSAEYHHKRTQPAAPKRYQPLWPADHGTFTRETAKVGRNDPCPCGSGKKYKKCCGV